MQNDEQRVSSRSRCASSGAGFSLVELLVVVAVILIISAIAIPNLLRSRASANEASAVQSIRTLVNAEHLYSSIYGNGFSPTLAELGGGGVPNCNAANLVDVVLASGVKNRYNFVYTGGAALPTPAPGCAAAGFGTFQLQADPAGAIAPGQRHFYSDQTGVIRQNATAPATATDPVLN